ncbi:unnamed protein product [Candidula unifasciata]|uniref:Endonuclease/exonuclease/phosphatase domain-containing protein n=1 Tax=Candidula unifasciata TaxID=100452 RepID=A0A8S3Z388_9EUPU|nr:unnamed protein product [Candidula unifasciata]
MPVVNTNREETNPLLTRVEHNDECALNSPERTHSDIAYLKSRKRCLRIGTWNVRTLYQVGKFDCLISEAKNMNLDILGVSETRWTEASCLKRDDYIFIISGGEHHERGVGMLMKRNLEKFISGFWAHNDRIILIKIKARPFDIAIIQTYAPTTDYSDEHLEEYYEELQKTLKVVKPSEVLIVMGDLNAKVGKKKQKHIVGQFGMGSRNDRGHRLIQFCEENQLIICNTFFQHPPRKLFTWKSPGDINRNQIDYVMIRDRFKNNIKKAKTYPGADINSDHNPVVIKIQIKLKNTGIRTQRSPHIDISALKQPEISQQYLVGVKKKI